MNILITGGSSDITMAIARSRLALGDKVIITTSNEKSLVETLNSYHQQHLDVEGIVYSFSDSEQIEIKLNRPIHALILNAFGRQRKLKTFHESSLNEFTEYYHQNIDGNVRLLHQIIPNMLTLQFGRVILVSSASVALGTKKYGAYCLAKSALEGLITNLAVEYGPQNILFNTVRLGLMKTSRTKPFWQRQAYQDYVNQMIPQGKMGEPEQVAEALAPLLSPTSYMTGSIIHVTGGLPLMNIGR